MNVKTLDDVRDSAKKLIKSNKPTKIKKIPTLQDTIDSIMNASSPARKANATRRLRLYAESRAKRLGSTPTRVIAGVCAAVTKRIFS